MLVVENEGTLFPNVVAVVFSSLAGEHVDGVPKFEFVHSLSGKFRKVVFVTDPKRGWYRDGIHGSNSANHTVKQLRQEIEEHESIFIGHSAGGYGAIVYGILCEATYMLAFSPQINGKSKWARMGFTPYMNLEEGLKKGTFTRLSIIYCSKYKDDEDQARSLMHIDNVGVIPLDCARHNSAQQLKQGKKLIQAIEATVKSGYKIPVI